MLEQPNHALGTPDTGGNTTNNFSNRIVLLVAACIHSMALILLLWSDEPRFGFAIASSTIAWLVVIIYLAESKLVPAMRTRWQLAGLGGLAVLLPLLFPGAPLQRPSPALLAHLLFGLAAYALFACAVLHAWFLRIAEKKLRLRQQNLNDLQQPRGLPVMTLERLMFAFVWAGFTQLSIALLAGLLFGETLYGSPASVFQKHLAHKIVFSSMAWLIFAALLIGRYWLGWRSKKAALMIYLGAGCLLLSYIGSHFVTEVILQRV